jgi:enoyl-CoA hydratase/carnithine racemase
VRLSNFSGNAPENIMDASTSATTSTAAPAVLRADHAGVTTLTLNRPATFNALSHDMLDALQAALDAVKVDSSVRVVVLAANGKAFCPGHDLKEMSAAGGTDTSHDYYRTLFAKCSKMMLTVHTMPQPVIARVHGIATAAGCQLVGMCDLAVAADSAKFAVSGINYGLFCSTPSVALGRNLRRKEAMEMLLTGEFISAHEAKEKGLINRVVAADALDAEIKKLTDSICAKSAVAVATGKQMFYKQLEMGIAAAYQYAGETMACNMMADDAQEGFQAFTEKRLPTWKHQ